MNKKQCETEHNDREMMSHPEWWSLPTLCVKRPQRKGTYECGVMTSVEGDKRWWIFLADDLTGNSNPNTTQNYISYDSIDRVLIGGWIVD